jgi:hypothetical protein
MSQQTGKGGLLTSEPWLFFSQINLTIRWAKAGLYSRSASAEVLLMLRGGGKMSNESYGRLVQPRGSELRDQVVKEPLGRLAKRSCDPVVQQSRDPVIRERRDRALQESGRRFMHEFLARFARNQILEYFKIGVME